MVSKYAYDEKEIVGATGFLFKGTVDSKVAWSNGEMLEIGTDDPFKALKRITWSKLKPDFQNLIDRYKGRREVVVIKTSPFLIPKPPLSLFSDVYKCHKLISSGDFTAIIQDKYFNFFKAHYPRCGFGLAQIDTGISPVSIYDKNGELVGLIMPMRV